MSINTLTHEQDGFDAHLQIGCDTIHGTTGTFDNLYVGNPPAPVVKNGAGQYSANITPTNVTNFVSQNTYYTFVGSAYVIYGYFRADINNAVNNVNISIDLAPGTSNQIARRMSIFGCNRGIAGAKAMMLQNDNNNTSTNLSLTCFTYDQSTVVAANQTNTTFYYNISYISG